MVNYNVLFKQPYIKTLGINLFLTSNEVYFIHTVEPVLGGICHEGPLVLKDRFHRHTWVEYAIEPSSVTTVDLESLMRYFRAVHIRDTVHPGRARSRRSTGPV